MLIKINKKYFLLKKKHIHQSRAYKATKKFGD